MVIHNIPGSKTGLGNRVRFRARTEPVDLLRLFELKASHPFECHDNNLFHG